MYLGGIIAACAGLSVMDQAGPYVVTGAFEKGAAVGGQAGVGIDPASVILVNALDYVLTRLLAPAFKVFLTGGDGSAVHFAADAAAETTIIIF